MEYDKTHVKVEAPNKKGVIFRSFSGKYEVYSGSRKGLRDGQMVIFKPQETKVITNEKGTSRIYY